MKPELLPTATDSFRNVLVSALAVFAVLFFTALPGLAEFKWSTGYGQGALAAQITNYDEAVLRISCDDEGSPTPGKTLLMVSFPMLGRDNMEGFVHALFKIDGVALPLLQEVELKAEKGLIEISADNMEGARRIWFVRLLEALSAGRRVTVAVPVVGAAAEFTLQGAREALKGARENCGLEADPVAAMGYSLFEARDADSKHRLLVDGEARVLSDIRVQLSANATGEKSVDAWMALPNTGREHSEVTAELWLSLTIDGRQWDAVAYCWSWVDDIANCGVGETDAGGFAIRRHPKDPRSPSLIVFSDFRFLVVDEAATFHEIAAPTRGTDIAIGLREAE